MAYLQKNHTELTTHNLAFDVNRKAAKEELNKLLKKPAGKSKSAKKVIAELKEHLTER